MLLQNMSSNTNEKLPIEYVEECTNNFHAEAKLDKGGGGEVFLAKEKKYTDIQFVAKRIHNENNQNMKTNAFKTELEVRDQLLL
jgi:hypothetical protein